MKRRSRKEMNQLRINDKVKRIMKIVSEVTGIQVSLIQAKTRKKEVVLARHIFCYISKNYTGASLSLIGSFLGNRDHTSVIHGRDKIKEILVYREDVADMVNHVISLFLNRKFQKEEYIPQVKYVTTTTPEVKFQRPAAIYSNNNWMHLYND